MEIITFSYFTKYFFNIICAITTTKKEEKKMKLKTIFIKCMCIDESEHKIICESTLHIKRLI